MNTIDVMRYGHETVLEAIDGLPEADWYTPGVCGVWSVKDIIAHLASFEQVLVDTLRSLSGDEPTPTLDRFKANVERFNDDEVARRRNMTAEEVLAEYEAAYARAITLMVRIPVEGRRLDGVLPWYGSEYSLEDFVVYAFYGHKREHSAEIAAFRDRLATVITEMLQEFDPQVII